MKNTKITFRWTKNEDMSKPNNNYNEETEYIIVGEDYDFADWLQDNDVDAEEESGTFYVLDDDDERTGEAYQIVSTEEVEVAETKADRFWRQKDELCELLKANGYKAGSTEELEEIEDSEELNALLTAAGYTRSIVEPSEWDPFKFLEIHYGTEEFPSLLVIVDDSKEV
jgi:hypothetical protein